MRLSKLSNVVEPLRLIKLVEQKKNSCLDIGKIIAHAKVREIDSGMSSSTGKVQRSRNKRQEVRALRNAEICQQNNNDTKMIESAAILVCNDLVDCFHHRSKGFVE